MTGDIDPGVAACDVVGEVLGGSDVAVEVRHLGESPAGAVLLVTLRSGRRLVVKLRATGHRVTGPEDGPARREPIFARTAAVMRAAGAVGVPVAPVLAADDSGLRRPWAYLVLEHVPGTVWREVRPRLTPREQRAVHAEILAAALRLRSIRFAGFGDLGFGDLGVGDHGFGPASRLRAAGLGAPEALLARASTRVPDPESGEVARRLLAAEAHLFDDREAVLTHDDLHHDNLLFSHQEGRWRLAAVLDWDRAWAGPVDADVAKLSFWDDMTGPGSWEGHAAARAVTDRDRRRAEVLQLLWCLEYVDPSPRHRADTEALRQRLGV